MTSEHVVRTFINQIKTVNPVLNAVVGERYDLALKEAAHVDSVLNAATIPDEYSQLNKPFLGVPIAAGRSNTMRFSRDDALRPFLTANEEMWKTFEPALRRRLEDLDQGSPVSDQV